MFPITFFFLTLPLVSLPDPGVTPFYTKEFFEVIRHYHQHSSLNVAVMTTKQWYQVLLEDRLITDNSPDTLIPTPVEILHPQLTGLKHGGCLG